MYSLVEINLLDKKIRYSSDWVDNLSCSVSLALKGDKLKYENICLVSSRGGTQLSAMLSAFLIFIDIEALLLKIVRVPVIPIG